MFLNKIGLPVKVCFPGNLRYMHMIVCGVLKELESIFRSTIEIRLLLSTQIT